MDEYNIIKNNILDNSIFGENIFTSHLMKPMLKTWQKLVKKE